MFPDSKLFGESASLSFSALHLKMRHDLILSIGMHGTEKWESAYYSKYLSLRDRIFQRAVNYLMQVPSRANMIDIDNTEDQDSMGSLHNLLPSTCTRHNFVLPRATTKCFFKKHQKPAFVSLLNCPLFLKPFSAG